MLPLWDRLQDEQLTSPLCALDVLQIAVYILYVPRLLALPSFKSSPSVLWAFPEKSILTLKLQALSPTGFKNSCNLGPFTFQTNCHADSFSMCTPLCACLSLTLLHDNDSLSTIAVMMHFSLKLYFHTSYLFQYGLFSTLVVDFFLPVFRPISGY